MHPTTPTKINCVSFQTYDKSGHTSSGICLGALDAVSILSSVTKLTVRTSSASYMLGEVFSAGGCLFLSSGRVVGMHPIGASALVPVIVKTPRSSRCDY